MHTTTGTGRLPMDHHYPIHGHAARSTWTGNNDYRRHVDGHDAGSRYTTSHRPSEQELDAAVANVLLGDRRNHHARRNTAYVGEYDVHRAGDLHAATRVSEDTDPIRQRLLGPTLTRARASTFTSAPATQPLVARFNPLPTHATSSAAGVRLRIHVDEAVHVAGGLVTGWLEVNRLQAGSAVRLGEAWVRLTGEEGMHYAGGRKLFGWHFYIMTISTTSRLDILSSI